MLSIRKQLFLATYKEVLPQLFLGDLIVVMHDACQMHPSLRESSYSNERICQIGQSQLLLQKSEMLHWIMVAFRHSSALAEILCGD